MPQRTFPIAIGDALSAAARIREFQQSANARTPGRPAPPLMPMVRLGTVLRALAPIVSEYALTEARLQAEYALKDPDGKFVIVRDANGNIQNGAFYIGDAPIFNQRLAEERKKAAEITVDAVSLDDVLDAGQDHVTPEGIADLLAVVDPARAEPTPEALARWEALMVRLTAANEPNTSASVASTNGVLATLAGPPSPAQLPPGSVPPTDPSAALAAPAT